MLIRNKTNKIVNLKNRIIANSKVIKIILESLIEFPDEDVDPITLYGTIFHFLNCIKNDCKKIDELIKQA